MRRRMPRYGTDSTGPAEAEVAAAGARPGSRPALAVVPPVAAARSTSSTVIRPRGPVPFTVARSIPRSVATRRAAGAAATAASPPPAAAAVGRLALAARSASAPWADPPAPCAVVSPSTTSMSAPTLTRSPSSTHSLVTVPDAGAGIVTTALSLSTSAIGWFSSTRSPTATSHFTSSTSARPSPMSGRKNSTTAMDSVLGDAADRGERAGPVRQIALFEDLHRIGRVGTADPTSGALSEKNVSSSSWIEAMTSAAKPPVYDASCTTTPGRSCGPRRGPCPRRAARACADRSLRPRCRASRRRRPPASPRRPPRSRRSPCSRSPAGRHGRRRCGTVTSPSGTSPRIRR